MDYDDFDSCCPLCGSEDITFGDEEFDTEGSQEFWNCYGCGKSFTIYKEYLE